MQINEKLYYIFFTESVVANLCCRVVGVAFIDSNSQLEFPN